MSAKLGTDSQTNKTKPSALCLALLSSNPDHLADVDESGRYMMSIWSTSKAGGESDTCAQTAADKRQLRIW